MQNTNLPYRYSERHFRRYEPSIAVIVRQWPMVTVLDPSPLALETFSCRLRDAIKSMRDNQWSSKDISTMKFVQIVDEITISTVAHPGKVSVGPYDVLRKLVPVGKPIEPNPESLGQAVPIINLVDPDKELIEAVLVLHHHRILVEPSVLTTKRFDVVEESSRFDIVVEKDGDRYTIY